MGDPIDPALSASYLNVVGVIFDIPEMTLLLIEIT